MSTSKSVASHEDLISLYWGAQHRRAMVTSVLPVATVTIAVMGQVDVISAHRYRENWTIIQISSGTPLWNGRRCLFTEPLRAPLWNGRRRLHKICGTSYLNLENIWTVKHLKCLNIWYIIFFNVIENIWT
jgi:hypothetical protein